MENLQILLNVCEEWSIEYGMQFNPSKCFYVGPRLHGSLTLYKQELIHVKQTTYLGIEFNEKGMDLMASLYKRMNSAKAMIAMLASVGFNLKGWPLSASALIYKTFIRSIMEYGLQLQLLKKKEIQLLQNVQNLALRVCTSSSKTTSINALHKLLLIEKMEVRNTTLNYKFGLKLGNSQDESIPATLLFQDHISKKKQKSLASKWSQKNILVKKFGHLSGDEIGKKTREHKLQTIQDLDLNQENVAGSILIDDLKTRNVCKPFAFQDKKHRISIIKWILGGVATHLPCKNCHQELSRKHAIECSGAHEFLFTKYGSILQLEENNKMNTIDILLNVYKYEPPNTDFYDDIYHAICMIYKNCLGYQMNQDGFWIENEQVNSNNKKRKSSTTQIKQKRFRANCQKSFYSRYTQEYYQKMKNTLGRPRKDEGIG